MLFGNCMSQKSGGGAGVAHALLRAVSRLVSTPAPLYNAASESVARTGRREESRRGTQECVRYSGAQMAHPNSMTSGGQRLFSTPELRFAPAPRRVSAPSAFYSAGCG